MQSKDSITSGLFWKFAERMSAQLVSFILSMVLARILMPEDYGVVAILLIFINIANVFVTQGFSTSLIQKKDSDELDFSTMFYCSLLCSLILYLLLFATAPFIADFYGNDILEWTLRILALKLPITSLNSIQQAYVSRHMIFRKFFYSSLIGTVASAVVGIGMALDGFGSWALVAQYLVNSSINTLTLFFIVPWRPHLLFSFERAKELMNYGWKVTLAELVSTGYTQLRSLIIGKQYTSTDLAYYNKGDQIPSLVVNNINASISTVLLPAMSAKQNATAELKAMTKKSMRLSAYVIFPMMGGLVLVADDLICLMLTEKWRPCVIFLQLACIAYALIPISTSNLQAIKAMGRSDLFLKMEILKKGVGILLVVLSMKYGTIAIAISAVVSSVFNNLVNMFPNKRLLDYGIGEQIIDLTPSFAITIFMCICLLPISKIFLNPFLTIVVQVLIGVTVYLGISAATHNLEFTFILNKVRRIKRK